MPLPQPHAMQPPPKQEQPYVPPQLLANETLPPPPPPPEPAAPTPCAEDDSVAALLLGFGAASRTAAPPPLPAPVVAPPAPWGGHAEQMASLKPHIGLDQRNGGAALLQAVGRADSGSGAVRVEGAAARRREREEGVPAGQRRGAPRQRLDEGARAWDSEEEDGGEEEDEYDDDDDDDEGRLEDVIDLRGYSPRAAIGLRVQVSYEERQGKQMVSVPYRGEVVSVDMRKGLRVKLDGYVRREWVTDEDEWRWVPPGDQALLPHQQELIDRANEADARAKGGAKAAGPAAKAVAHVVLRLRGAEGVRLPGGTKPPQQMTRRMRAATAPRTSSGGSESESDDAVAKPAEKPQKQAPLASIGATNSAPGGKNPEVTVAAGAHAGEKATVLHVGNGWVRLQLGSGAVVHLRKWDLQGEIPTKVRSPAVKPLAKVAVPAPEPAAPAGPSPREERAAERERTAGAEGKAESVGKASKSKGGAAAGSAEAAPAGGAEAAGGAAPAAAKEPAERPKKRPPPELIAEGFVIGAPVWARLSFIKFSHGVIQRVQSSSKWVLVRLDSGADQWVTVRELVLDAPPQREAVADGLEVIAAWPGEDSYYKGTILSTNQQGGYSVRYDDWDEQTVGLSQIRLLPDTFGGKKKRDDARAKANLTSSAAAAAALAKPPPPAPNPLQGAMESFVAAAKEQLLASQPDTFERLTQLLAHFGAAEQAPPARKGAAANGSAEASRSPTDSALRSLLSPHPRLLSELEQLLAAAPATPAEARGADGEPTLCSWRWEEDGRLTGRVYGKAGFKDGTLISTSAVPLEQRLKPLQPHARVVTESGTAYHLGLAAAAPLAEGHALRGEGRALSGEGHAELAATRAAAAAESEEDAERDPSESGEPSGKPAVGEGRGPKAKGARELQKLLDEFGGGAAVGVDGEIRRRRGAGEG